MKFFSRLAASADMSIRASLLRGTLYQYCSSNRQTAFDETIHLEDAATPVALLESLSAFQKPKNAAVAFFDGLVNAPDAHLGRNVLVCAQPLQTELAMFAARNGLETAQAGLWWKNVLRNFERVIFLDRYALAQSAGFAPWARLSLADHFPVILQAAPSQRINAQVIIFNHDPAVGAQDILVLYDQLASDCTLSVLTVSDPQPADPVAVANAAIHIHYGYDNHIAPVGLTPYDSLANGVYTVALSSPIKAAGRNAASRADVQRRQVDARIAKEIRSRSYALLADDVDEAVVFVKRTLDRLGRFAEENLSINPELQRFDRMNEEYISSMLVRFTKQVPA